MPTVNYITISASNTRGNRFVLFKRGLFRVAIICFILFLGFPLSPSRGENYPVGPIEPVPAVPVRPEWNRFVILIWQYQTDILKDLELYRKARLHGFHIDRGADAAKLVKLSRETGFPYYVDHAANKGILYLRNDKVKDVTNKPELIERPFSLADPRTIEMLKEYLKKNIAAAMKGLALTYAFDDEISLGRFTNPADVDSSTHSIAWFRGWLKWKYKKIEALNQQWESHFVSFDTVMPSPFEGVRGQMLKKPISGWNFSPWMDFRQFMDDQFAMILKELTLYANQLDPKTPAGFVGGQGPSPWGGYDYAKLSRVVQWMEAYDILGADEILRSFWNKDRKPRMHTFFSGKNPKPDSWFLWYYLVHGNHAMIAWPEGWFHSGGHDIAPHILANKQVFQEIQGPVSEMIVDQKTRFDADPIGIYYSHPGIQAGWAMDTITHGKTWVKRSSSLDNENQTIGVLRKAWFKILEDLGFQYEVISYLDVMENRIDLNKHFKVIILPKTICLSDKEAEALQLFVKKGGVLIADYLCGVMDEHGKGREKGILDELFGVIRDEQPGYLNGKGLTEIDGEKFDQPFLSRFTYYGGAYRHKGIAVFERGIKGKEGLKETPIESNNIFGRLPGPSVLIENHMGKGRLYYLNLSFVEYWDASKRFGEYGKRAREILGGIFNRCGLTPRVVIKENGHPDNMIEAIFWKRDNEYYLCLIKNPSNNSEEKKLLNGGEGVQGNESLVKMVFRDKVKKLKNLRTGREIAGREGFDDDFRPWEANIYLVEF